MARWLYLHADYKLRCLDSYRYLSSRYYLEVEILVLNEWRGKKYSVLCFSSSLDDNLPNSRHIKLAIQIFHSKKYIFSNSIAQHFISATFKHRYNELNNQQEFILKSGQNILVERLSFDEGIRSWWGQVNGFILLMNLGDQKLRNFWSNAHLVTDLLITFNCPMGWPDITEPDELILSWLVREKQLVNLLPLTKPGELIMGWLVRGERGELVERPIALN